MHYSTKAIKNAKIETMTTYNLQAPTGFKWKETGSDRFGFCQKNGFHHYKISEDGKHVTIIIREPSYKRSPESFSHLVVNDRDEEVPEDEQEWFYMPSSGEETAYKWLVDKYGINGRFGAMVKGVMIYQTVEDFKNKRSELYEHLSYMQGRNFPTTNVEGWYTTSSHPFKYTIDEDILKVLFSDGSTEVVGLEEYLRMFETITTKYPIAYRHFGRKV